MQGKSFSFYNSGSGSFMTIRAQPLSEMRVHSQLVDESVSSAPDNAPGSDDHVEVMQGVVSASVERKPMDIMVHNGGCAEDR